MKKISVLLLAAALSLSLSACGNSSETTAAESPDAVTTLAAAPSLEGEYLEDTWEWQESMSPGSLTKMRSFKLKADGTGKILSFDGDKPDSSRITAHGHQCTCSAVTTAGTATLSLTVNIWLI